MSLTGFSASAHTVLPTPPRACPLALERPSDLAVSVRPRMAPRLVLLRGEQDRATADDLVGMLAGTIELADADLIVDLHDVTFMDASTLGALVGVRNMLGRRERTLAVRAPPRIARRLFDICGLSDLIEVPTPAGASPTRQAS